MIIGLIYSDAIDLFERVIRRILVANAGLDSRTLCNTRDPLHQMWKRLHIFLGEA